MTVWSTSDRALIIHDDPIKDDWIRFFEFLIFGNDDVSCLDNLLENDMGVKMVDYIVSTDICNSFDNTYILYTLAVIASYNSEYENAVFTKALPHICKSFETLTHFLNIYKPRWGRRIRRRLEQWMFMSTPEQLALEFTKKKYPYCKPKDLLRVVHPKASRAGKDHKEYDELFAYTVNKWTEDKNSKIHDLLVSIEQLQWTSDVDIAIRTLKSYPIKLCNVQNNRILSSPRFWEAIIPTLSVRDIVDSVSIIGKLTNVPSAMICDKLQCKQNIIDSEMNPLEILNAVKSIQYTNGERNVDLMWGLDDAFYHAFENIPVTSLRYFIAADLSASMDCGKCRDFVHLSPREVCAAMLMMIVRREPFVQLHALCDGIPNIDIRKTETYHMIIQTMKTYQHHVTEHAAVIHNAIENQWVVDCFVIITNKVDEYEKSKPLSKALAKYRKRVNPNAKAVLISLTDDKPYTSVRDNILNIVGINRYTWNVFTAFTSAYT